MAVKDDRDYKVHTAAFLAVFKAYVTIMWGRRCVPKGEPLDPKEACCVCIMWDLYDRTCEQVK